MKPKVLLLVFAVSILSKIKSEYIHTRMGYNDAHLSSPAERNKRSVNERNQTEYVVEVALFCDKECGDYFYNDRNKTLKYLLAMVLDANMYFTSLHDYNVLFAVTSFTQLNSTTDQPFVESGRINNGTTVLLSILRPFGEWLLKNTTKLPAFDFAILFTGSTGLSRSHTYSSSLCLGNIYNVFWGTAVFRLFLSSDSICNDLAKSFAYGFGHASLINQNSDHNNCWDKEYVFETKALNCSSPHKYFFSSCSNNVISRFFLLHKAHCLVSSKLEKNSEYTISYDSKFTPTMKEQCNIATNRTDVYSKHENCLKTSCYERIGANESFVKDIYPMANTPCGDSKICFRGRCLSKGYRIRNTNYSTCIVSSNRFSYNDTPALSQCAKLSTPLDRLMLYYKGDQKFYLANPYSTLDAEENADKCLTVDCKYNNLMFDRCPDNNSWFEWSFIKSDPNEQTFLLFHPTTQKCVNIYKPLGLLRNMECEFNQSTMQWEFIEEIMSDVFVVTTTKDDSANLAFMSHKSSKSTISSSTDKFGVGIVVGILLAFVLMTTLFVARHFLNAIKFRLTRNGYHAEPAVYHREQNIILLGN